MAMTMATATATATTTRTATVTAMAMTKVTATAPATATVMVMAVATATAMPRAMAHQKQHYVPYYLSIVFFPSLKYAFGFISMFFTLVRCSIILSRLFLTYLHPCFLPYVQIYQISVPLLMSYKKMSHMASLVYYKIWDFRIFFVLYCILVKFIMFYSKCPKCHTHFFLFV